MMEGVPERPVWGLPCPPDFLLLPYTPQGGGFSPEVRSFRAGNSFSPTPRAIPSFHTSEWA